MSQRKRSTGRTLVTHSTEGTFGGMVADARIAADISQEELALKCGVLRTTVAMWENSHAYPSVWTLACLVDALGMDANPLLVATHAEESANAR